MTPVLRFKSDFVVSCFTWSALVASAGRAAGAGRRAAACRPNCRSFVKIELRQIAEKAFFGGSSKISNQ
ncbi:hypothetical protein AUK18_00960 [Candidatus Beckwithbacteria bacterium CG2_30_44_31]|uniref:Uncharacterized protein n=1 Tax=Candidatus Beckwithbacteria bacterium CG2_30_44_31 TaxID=1805035 RepID=A0A1J5AZG3_9BACT|nr:MAG: hypothetical protein AUK18_00960 [Candidatus Beckwithbacteria bacterium CG2_30_44_31]